MTKVRSKKIFKRHTKERTVHLAALMDICHLKNSELEPKFRKYNGSDIVNDDSGSYAVFTEQGSSASQMTAGKYECYCKTSRMLGTSSCCSVRWYPSQHGGRSSIAETSHIQNVQTCGYVYQDTSGPNHGSTLKSRLFFLNAGNGWHKVPNWECLFVHRQQEYSCQCTSMTSK